MVGRAAEDVFVGIFALAGAIWIVWILVRAKRSGRLPIRRGEVLRAGRPGAFATLFVLYVAALLLMTAIGLDLLFDFTGRR